MANTTLNPSGNKQEWAQAADNAKAAAASVGEMASHCASAVGAMASEAACEAGKKADDLAASAGVSIQGLGDRFGKNSPQGGVLGNASQAVAKSIKDGGEYLEGAKLSGMTEDMAQLIKRNPIPAVLIAMGLGWFVARNLRS